MAVTAINIPALGEHFSPGVYHMQTMLINATDCSSAAANTIANIYADTDNRVWMREIRTRVNTAFTASGTITIGDTDADGWLVAATIACTTAVTTGLMKSSNTDGTNNANGIAFGKLYEAADYITLTVDGCAAGQLEVAFIYAMV